LNPQGDTKAEHTGIIELTELEPYAARNHVQMES